MLSIRWSDVRGSFGIKSPFLAQKPVQVDGDRMVLSKVRDEMPSGATLHHLDGRMESRA
jgi:hypothetical protein